MFNMITKKIKNKLWLTVCLVLGMAFLVAVFCCQPMFKMGSLNMLIVNSFEMDIREKNQYPVVFGRYGSINVSDVATMGAAESKVNNYQQVWEDYLPDIDVLATQTVYEFSAESSQGSYGSKGNYVNVSYMPNLTDHIEVLKGSDYYEYASEEGYYPCLISEKVMDEFGLVQGEVIEFVNWKNSSDVTLKLVVAGIFKEADRSDLYWYIEPTELSVNVFVSKETYEDIMLKYPKSTMSYRHFSLFDYQDINSSNIEDLQYYIEEFKKADTSFMCTFEDIITDYNAEKKTVNVILWVLELPILGMVLAFIYMVSKQIVDSEKNEIAMLKSRGLNRKQIVATYGLQSAILAGFGFLIGVPLGYLLCKLAAGTTDFLTFSWENMWVYRFVPLMFVYGIVAAFIGVCFVLAPVVVSTKISIVEYKSSKNEIKKSVWEKYFLDIALLGVSIYLLYNYNQNSDMLRQKAIEGEKMDPMIFLNSLVFIIGLGLVALRLTHYVVKLVYILGKKKWSPAIYASFLQITRNSVKQGFISVFLILTVALGLFNANTARTINRNNEDRITYEIGSDMVIQEHWDTKLYYLKTREIEYDFVEPNYARYTELINQGICDSMTRVIYDDRTIVRANSMVKEECIFMGVHTKEFGETAYLKEELNLDTHWYTYLNALAENPNGVIISSNMAKEMEVEVGDIVRCDRMGAIPGKYGDVRGTFAGTVVAVVDNWPGYNRYYYEEGELKERYLLVANYASAISAFKITPYQIWMNVNEDATYEDVMSYLDNKGVVLDDSRIISEEISLMKSSPMIQITNGMFTLSFIIALILCAIGFLIYWISSIRQRELLFGVYRAMGMSVKEINKMLTNEHIFSTFFSVLAGGLVGMVATLLYVKVFGIVYLPERHNLDIYIYFEIGDVIKLAVVVTAMIVVCMFVLRKLIKSLNITQALKLGEE